MQQPVTTVVQVNPNPSDEVGVAEVLLGPIALTALIVLIALLVGVMTGGLFILRRKWRDAHTPDNAEPAHTRLNLSTPHE